MAAEQPPNYSLLVYLRLLGIFVPTLIVTPCVDTPQRLAEAGIRLNDTTRYLELPLSLQDLQDIMRDFARILFDDAKIKGTVLDGSQRECRFLKETEDTYADLVPESWRNCYFIR